MNPTEYEATVAVDAAARKAYADAAAGTGPASPEWDDMDVMHQNAWRQTVLPLVWAALNALPDRACETCAEREAATDEIQRQAERKSGDHKAHAHCTASSCYWGYPSPCQKFQPNPEDQ